MADERMFQEALDAIERGQSERARDLLTRLLREEQSNADYWLYLSAVVDTQKERVFCLENALKADPSNETAQRGLTLIGASTPDPLPHPVKPNRQREFDSGEVLGSAAGASRRLMKEDQIEWPYQRIGAMLVVGLIAAIMMFFGFTGNPNYIPTAVAVVNMGQGQPLATSGPTATYLPTNTPYSGPTPTFSGETPLAYALQVSITPTPRYVDTPHPSSEAYTAGMRSLDQSNWSAAIESFLQHIENSPGDADVRYYLALAYLGQEEYLDALDAINKAININPNLGPAYIVRAKIQRKLNPTASVGDDLNKAVSLSPDYVGSYLERAAYLLARNNPDAAQGDVETALELDPNNGLAHYYQALIYTIAEDYTAALEAAEMAQSLDPTIVENYFLLGQALVETGQEEAAIGYLQTYLTYAEENATAWLLLGRAQQAGGYHDTALMVFDKALSLQDDLYEINYYRGYALLELGEYEDALTALRNAARIFPRWFEPQLAIGRALLEMGDAGNGYTEINKSQSLAKTDRQLAALYYWRALALEALEEYEFAIRDWEKLLALPTQALESGWYETASQHVTGVPTPGPTYVPSVTPTPSP